MSAYDVGGGRLRGVDQGGLIGSVIAHPPAGSVFGQRRLRITQKHRGEVGHPLTAISAAAKDGRNQANAQQENANVRNAHAAALL
jgi:hypothetical protein